MKYVKAAGVIPVTHASGGPLNDIVVPFDGAPTGPPHSSVSLSIAMLLNIKTSTGYHATTPDTFAAAMHSALTLSTSEELALRQRARTWAVQKFSEEEFEKGWNATGWRTWLPQ